MSSFSNLKFRLKTMINIIKRIINIISFRKILVSKTPSITLFDHSTSSFSTKSRLINTTRYLPEQNNNSDNFMVI